MQTVKRWGMYINFAESLTCVYFFSKVNDFVVELLINQKCCIERRSQTLCLQFQFLLQPRGYEKKAVNHIDSSSIYFKYTLLNLKCALHEN